LRLRFTARFVQNGESIGVRFDKSSKCQIVRGDLRQFQMAAGGLATVGKWQIEAAIIE
jgi:hypothetical protein